MGEKNSVCRFSLLFLAAAVALSAGHAHGSDICANAIDAPLCRDIVKGATEPAAALRAAIERLIHDTELANSGPLVVCKKNFDDAISDLQRSLEFLNIKDKDSLNTQLAAVRSDYSLCYGAFVNGGFGGLSGGAFKTNNPLLDMAANVIYLASLPWLPH